VISQILLPKATGEGRVAALEIMISTPAIANLIRENKSFRITSDIQTGAKHGMRTLDSHLLELYSAGLIAYEEMIEKAHDPEQVAIQASQTKKGEKHGAFAQPKTSVQPDKQKGWLG
jgi:twitching motility protein PilT